MLRNVIQRPRALAEVRQIAEYIARDSEEASIRFFAAMDETNAFLAEFPESGERILTRNPALKGLRLWPVKGFPNYLVLFRVADETVDVLSVVHGSRSRRKLLMSLK